MTAEPVALDPVAAIARLEALLAATPRARRPIDHATVAYRLGLALAEQPNGNPEDNLRRALAHYDVAISIFDARFDPVEHARVLNAAAAAHRALGNTGRAIDLFDRAATILEGQGRDDERAAALNNLGLARSDLGEIDAAVAVFATAADLFDATTAEGRRGQAAALVNEGLAHAAGGTPRGFDAALDAYARARAALDADEAPYHRALIDHSVGVAETALAAAREAERAGRLREAIGRFEDALNVFTKTAFPWQYALCKHNLGRALAATGDLTDARRGLACCEEALTVVDPRLHRDAWQHVHASMEAIERSLRELDPAAPPATRAEHFVALAAAVDDRERTRWLRERLERVAALPDDRRHAALVELALASARLEPDAARVYIETELAVLMELPSHMVEAGLLARIEAHRSLPEDLEVAASGALDLAIGDALGLSQRILIRDHLMSMGFERP